MYKLYQYKPIKFGFVILCPNCNFGHLKNTLNSINAYYPNNKITIVVPDNCKADECPKAIKGGTTLASMINRGLKESVEWSFVACTEGWIKSHVDIKYSYFIESKKDILFPILKTKNLNCNFIDQNINGILVHKDAFADIGDFPNFESVESSKLIWTTKAIEKGYKFKGVVGGRLF